MDRSDQRNYVFDEFVADFARGSLTHRGETRSLRPQSFKVLEFLIQNHGRVVSKQELFDAIWPGAAVTDDSLVQCLIDIRKALGEDGQSFIKTIPRRGYIFEAPLAEHSAPSETKQRFRWLAPVATGAVLFIALGAWLIYGTRSEATAGTRSILILPFNKIAPGLEEPSTEIGMADTLITRLGRLKGLIVRPTSAVFEYVGKKVDVLEVGRRHTVDMVLEGSIRESQEQIRVSARLLNVRDGMTLWSQTFDQKKADLFEIEDAISRQVVAALDLRLTTDEQKTLTKRPTNNTEAYALYQQGLFQQEQGTRASTEKAEKYLLAAVEADPGLAPAYSALAAVYRNFSSPSGEGKSDPRIQMLLQKALEIDGDLADARSLLGEVKSEAGDFAGAEAEFRAALDSGPNAPFVNLQYASHLMVLRQDDKALEYARRECNLDPLSSRGCLGVAIALSVAGQYDRAIEEYKRILKADPGFAPGHTDLATAYLGKHAYGQAIAELEGVLKMERAPERVRFTLLAFAYARSGRQAEARAMLAEMMKEKERRFIQEELFGAIHAALGENDQAFAWLEKAYKDRPGPPFVRLDIKPMNILLQVLRDDPRFEEFTRRKGLAL